MPVKVGQINAHLISDTNRSNKIKSGMMNPSRVSTREIRPYGLGRRVTKEEKTSEKDRL